MYRRRLAALLILVPLALALAPPALAHTRLAGEFTMIGRVIVARDVPGEYVGEPVTRMWSFLAPCPFGQCVTEQLMRARAVGGDVVTLVRDRGMFSHWVGSGTFYAPLQCGSRIYPRGERVSFTIKVRISAVALVNGAPVATAVKAGYSDTRRTNTTRCVAALGHDAAVYTGQLAGYPPYP